MKIETHSQLLDALHQYFDKVGLLHCFNDCYNSSETSSVMLLSVFLPIASDIQVVKSIPYFNTITEVHVHKSGIPNFYYVEFIYNLV